MKKFLFLCLLNYSLFSLEEIQKPDAFENIQINQPDWIIVGDGPAAISTIGVLLEIGTLPLKIKWIGPEFNVGRLSCYKDVSANTKNKMFVKFLESCKVFKQIASEEIEAFKTLDPEKEYPLENIIKPLQAITKGLMNKVNIVKGKMESLDYDGNVWHVGVNNEDHVATHVVLATGSYPKRLELEGFKDKEIPLDKALDKCYMKNVLSPDDTVAVVGSAHSAILLLKYISELKVKKIYNFYNKPILYPVDMGGWTLYDQSGIVGIAAEWAKNILEKGLAPTIERVLSTEENLNKILPECTKIIYSIGFARNELPFIKENPTLDYDHSTGIIGPRLFGIGIAFPEVVIDPAGNAEYSVGLPSFMRYAQKVVPCWAQKNSEDCEKQKEMLKLFEEIFYIQVL